MEVCRGHLHGKHRLNVSHLSASLCYTISGFLAESPKVAFMQRTYPARNSAPQPVAPRPRTPIFRWQPRGAFTWLVIIGAILFFLTSITVVALALGAMVVYSSGRILPGVSVMGTRIGGMTTDDAA